MNQVSSYQIKLIALQFALESKTDNLMETAQTIYDWLLLEVEFEESKPNVTHLTPVN